MSALLAFKDKNREGYAPDGTTGLLTSDNCWQMTSGDAAVVALIVAWIVTKMHKLSDPKSSRAPTTAHASTNSKPSTILSVSRHEIEVPAT